MPDESKTTGECTPHSLRDREGFGANESGVYLSSLTVGVAQMRDHNRIEELERRLSALYAEGSDAWEEPSFFRAKVDDINAELSELRDKISWPRPIPVGERLPDHHSGVLAFGYAGAGKMYAWYRAWMPDKEHWIIDCSEHELGGVTHWLPLPPRPDDSRPVAPRA